MNRNGMRSFNDHDDRVVTSYGRGGRGRGSRGRGSKKDYLDDSPAGGGVWRGKSRSSRGGSFRSRSRGRSRYNKGSGRGVNPRSRLIEDDEGDFQMDGGSSRHRQNPYERPGNHGKGTHRSQSSKYNDQWYKVIMPYGKNATKEYILRSLQSLSDVAFEAVMFHYDQKKAVFYVKDRHSAMAIKNCSRKIVMPNGLKLVIETTPCKPPTSFDHLDSNTFEKLKLSMSKRYEPEKKALNLENLYNDKDLNSEGIHLALQRPSVAERVLEVISENIPELETLNIGNNRLFSLDSWIQLHSLASNIKCIYLKDNVLKHERELDKLKNLQIVELYLEGNPLCDSFKDDRAYISTMRKKFPSLVKLDGHELPAPIKFEVNSSTSLPSSQESFFPTEKVQSLVYAFLKQYLSIYDSDNRDKLMEAYHPQAIFSLSWYFNDLIQSKKSGFVAYTQESRNLSKIQDSFRREKFLKVGKLNIVAFLTGLPSSQHDHSSIVIDVSQPSDSLLCFTVNGVFKETDGKGDVQPIRSFSRVFTTIPQGSGIVIINDQLTLMNATQELIKNSFRKPAPTPSSSPVPSTSATTDISDVQNQMITQFSTQSGMNEEWSLKCLLENNWDYQKSAQVFSELRAKGSIPAEAFGGSN